MKPIHFIAPVLALAIAGGILGAQRNSIARVEDESTVLRSRIEAAKSRPDLSQQASRPGRTNQPGSEKDDIDWKEMAVSFGEMQRTGGVKDMRKMMSFQRKIQALDKDGLIAAMDEIALLELDDMQRMMLENMLIGSLVQKDPELALTRFADRIGDEKTGMGWQLANALGEWAKKDPLAATAWFDRQIASGTFDSKSLDGKSTVRMAFEGGLVKVLLETDPKAAKARILALPAEQRKDVFGGFGFMQMKATEQTAFADLARQTLSESEKTKMFADQASKIAMTGDYKKVEEFMDRIAVTPEERVSSAEEAARGSIQKGAFQTKVTPERIDSMREWLGTQAPDSVEKITGESLGSVMNFGGSMKFAEASEVVLKYHAETGSDDLLTGFLRNANVFENKEAARAIAEKISDPGQRAKALERIK